MKVDLIDKLDAALKQSGLDQPNAQYSHLISNRDAIIGMLQPLGDDEQALMIQFVGDYMIEKEYNWPLWRLIDLARQNHGSKINLFPLVNNNTQPITSSRLVITEMRDMCSRDEIDQFNFYDAHDSEKLLRSGLPSYCVDDFIGTGERFFQMREEQMNKNSDFSLSGVLTVFCMRDAKDRIERQRCPVFADSLAYKAIQHHIAGRGGDVGAAYKLYNLVESRLNIKTSEKLGRGQCEALISTRGRTPNNTLPVFWCKKGSSGNKWPAPFPR